MSRETTNFNSIENTSEGIYRGLLTLREDFDSHIHDGTNSRQFETLQVRTLVAGNSVIAVNSLAVTKKSYTDDTAGIWMGLHSGVAKIYIGNSTNSVKWDGSALTIIGGITATTGTIGGFTIGSDFIRDAANSMGLASTVTGGDDVRFWAGAAFASRSSAPFRVTEAGVLTSTSGVIGGFTIASTTISGGSSMVIDSSGTGIITAGTIRTASSGTRVELTPTNEIKFYNGASFVGSIFSSSTTGIGFFDSSGVLNAAVLSTNGDIAISKSGGSFLLQSGGTFGWLTHNNVISSVAAGRVNIDCDWEPASDSTYNLGREDLEWAIGFIDKIAGNSNNNVIDLGGSGQILTNQNYCPSSAAGVSLGDATLYWNDVSYKTLTDRGCLGWFDEGVELQDGRKVSDTEALLAIEKDEEKTTVYGKPMLKYSSLPKAVYKPVDKEKEPNGVEGAETTALISIMIGAIKELTNRVKELEAVDKA